MTPLALYLGILLLLALLAASYTITSIWTGRLVRTAKRREIRAQQDREEVVGFLNRFCMSMVTNQDRDAWRLEVAGYLREVLSAEALQIYLLDDDELELICSAGKLPAIRGSGMSQRESMLEKLHQKRVDLGDGPIGEVAMTRRSTMTNYVSESEEGAAVGASSLESLLAVPMLINDQLLGVVCVVNRCRHGCEFSADDQFLLEALSMQVALGETLVVALDELGTQERIRQELSLARRIQDSLLPPSIPETDQLRIHAVGASAREVGGDFYDFVELDDDLLMVVIADASGKGVPASMLMAMCRSLMRSNASRYRNDLEGLMLEVNRNLYADTDAAQFVTLACCLIDRRDFTVEYVRAGHSELLLRLPEGRVRVIEPDGPALGLLDAEFGVSYDTFSFNWRPGMSIMLFTDGLTEARGPSGEEFGRDRLVEAWKKQSLDPKATVDGIFAEVEGFQGDWDAEDDQTLVVLNRLAEKS